MDVPIERHVWITLAKMYRNIDQIVQISSIFLSSIGGVALGSIPSSVNETFQKIEELLSMLQFRMAKGMLYSSKRG